MISFNSQNISFKTDNLAKKKKWLKALSLNEGYKIIELNYVFLNDDDLLKMNINYLNHNTLTDIITFDNSEKPKNIEGDIFISIERVKENADRYGVEFENELIRVLAHGLLHLCGYKDKTSNDKKQMSDKEDYYIDNYFAQN
jgi:rRNA maturation RNase YbeY